MTTKEVEKTTQGFVNPFESRDKYKDINQGVVAVEAERAIADVKGKLIMARQFPRDESASYARLMNACSRKVVAEHAVYAYPRGGQTVTGPSIRLAEEIARCLGNIEFGIRELSQKDGYSEMEAYAWDLETNTRSIQHFTVVHKREKKTGAELLTSDRDIYEKTANDGARRLRSRILAIVPPEFIEDALAMCHRTMQGKNDEPIEDRIKKFVAVFAKHNVSKELLEKRLGYSVDNMTADDLVEYTKIYNSMKDGMTTSKDWFDVKKVQSESAKNLTNAFNGDSVNPSTGEGKSLDEQINE